MALFEAFGNDAARRAQNEGVRRQDKYNTQKWRYENKEGRRNVRYARKGIEIARQNTEAEYSWRDDLARSEYDYNLKISDFEYGNAMLQYAKSEQNYRDQLKFNNIAAAFAYEAEDRKLNEIMIGKAFESQDQMIAAIQSEGKALARGQVGRSAGKTLQAEVAQYGRNLAVLAESVTSAEKNYNMSRRKINIDKMGADLAAEAARMIMPSRAPVPPEPKPLPRPVLQDPLKWKKTPKPPKGVQMPSTLGWDLAGDALDIALSFIPRK